MEQVEGEPPLHVEIQGGDIVVMMPGTDFSVAYQKPEDKPHLVLTQCRLPLITTPAVSEFRARAFQTAVEKALLVADFIDSIDPKRTSERRPSRPIHFERSSAVGPALRKASRGSMSAGPSRLMQRQYQPLAAVIARVPLSIVMYDCASPDRAKTDLIPSSSISANAVESASAVTAVAATTVRFLAG